MRTDPIQKEVVPVGSANRLINHGGVILVTSCDDKRRNIITLAWQMPVSHRPALAAISVAPSRYSHELIEKSRVFVINVPSCELLDAVMLCGTSSGRNTDKFKASGLTETQGHKVDCPLIMECFAHLECRVTDQYSAGDHTVFIGEVVYACADKGLFRDTLRPDSIRTLHHLGGTTFTCTGKRGL